MKNNATQKDVARLAGVSQATVSRYISGSARLSPDVRGRILRAIDTLGYTPDPMARGLSSGQSDIVAIVMANITNPWYPAALELMTRALQERGLQTLLFNATPPQTVDDLIPSVLQYRVNGVIITTAVLSSFGAELCRRHKVPVVLFNRATRTGGVHSVSCDNVEGGRKAADILLKGGARRLVFIGGMEEASTSRDRKKGFTDRLGEWDVALLDSMDKEFTYEWGYAATLDLFSRHRGIDAVCCADDEIATGAVDALRYELQLRVPEDVQVLGFDDHPASSHAAYQLTTIRQPVEEMIAHTLDLLLAHPQAPAQVRLCRGEIVYRQSAGERARAGAAASG